MECYETLFLDRVVDCGFSVIRSYNFYQNILLENFTRIYSNAYGCFIWDWQMFVFSTEESSEFMNVDESKGVYVRIVADSIL